MSQPRYLKCACQGCSESIEFPAEGTGQTISCPHCGQTTTLCNESVTGEAIESEPKGSKGKIPWLLLLAIVIAAGGTAILILKSKASKKTSEDSVNLLKTSETARSAGADSGPTNSIPDSRNAVRSIDDLKVGAITLEKAKGSSLVYAVGVLRNNSDLQRFGVTLELDLADSRGNSAGSAKDYRSVIEPRQEWRFRALVLDSKAVSAKLARIREEQ